MPAFRFSFPALFLSFLVGTANCVATAGAYEILPGHAEALTAEAAYNVVAVDGQGRLLLGGSFRVPGTEFGEGLVRVNVDGSVDASFHGVCSARATRADVKCTVGAIAIAPTGDIFIAGTEVGPDYVPRSFLSKLSPDGALDPQWAPLFPIEQSFPGFAKRLEVRGTTLTIIGDVGLDQGQRVVALRASTQGAGTASAFVARIPATSFATNGSSDAAGNVYVHHAGAGASALVRFLAPTGVLDSGFAPFTNPYSNGESRLPLVTDTGAILVNDEIGLVRAIDASGATLSGWPTEPLVLYSQGPSGTVLAMQRGPDGDRVWRIPVAAPDTREVVAQLPPVEIGQVAMRGTGVAAIAAPDDIFNVPTPDQLYVFDAGGVLDPRFRTAVLGVVGATPVRNGHDVYLAGGFDRVGAISRTKLARFTNGAFDAGWQPQVAGSVQSLSVSGAALLGKGFLRVPAGTDHAFVDLDPASGAVSGWPQDFSFLYGSFPVPDGVGGQFFFGGWDGVTACGPTARRYGIHVLSGSSCVIDATFAPAFGDYRLMANGNDGWLYGVRTESQHLLRRISATTGAEDPSWGAILARPPLALTLSSSAVFVAVTPDGVDPTSLPVLLRSPRSTGAIDASWSSPVRALIREIDVEGSALFVGGTSFGASASYEVWRIDSGTGAVDPQWRLKTNGADARFVPIDAGIVVVSGVFSRANGADRNGLVAYGGEPPLFQDSFE